MWVVSRRPRVPAMQPANLGDRDAPALAGLLDLTRDRCVAAERQVASRLVVVREVLGEDPQQVRLFEDDQVVQALAANLPNRALEPRVHSGSRDVRRNLPN